MTAGNGKTGEVLYSISQVHALTGVPKSTIRFWEKEFSEFLVPLRTLGGQRRYDRGDVEIIQKIDKLVNEEGFTLEGARKQLRAAMEAAERSHSRVEDEQLNELAITMSDYLLQKLFERIRAEELARGGRENKEK